MAQERLVAFQGELGAYSHQAIGHYFGEETAVEPCRSFLEVLEKVRNGRVSHGFLPVENSLAGSVIPAYDLLFDYDCHIEAEVMIRVVHCLLAPPGVSLSDIKRAKSHPQALAQCAKNLLRLNIEPVEHYDTAGAARDLAQSPEPHTAAIASALAGQIYGLNPLITNLEDFDFNFTRFFVLTPSIGPRRDPSKTSIIFTTRHEPGALQAVLSELAQHGLNMTKIESRPRHNQPWQYLFYVDFEGHQDDAPVQAALLGILKKSSFLKVLGSYPMAHK